MENKIKGGLNYVSPTIRDFKYSQSFGAVDLSQLPKDGIGRKPTKILNQFSSDFCTSFGSAAMRSFTEGVDLDPFWIWAKAAQIRGDWKQWGLTLPEIVDVLRKYGILEEAEQPLNLLSKDRDFLAQYSNYPDLTEKAKKHIGGARFWVDGPYTFFDNCRSVLWQNRLDNLVILVGAEWHEEWSFASNGIITVQNYNPKSQWFGHAFVFIDFKQINGEDFLIAQLSNGEEFGDKGLFYFSREVVNSNAFRFGGVVVKDYDPELAKKQWNIMAKIVDLLYRIVKLMKEGKKEETFDIEEFLVEEAIKTPEKISRIKDWAEAITQFENMTKYHKEKNNPGAIKGLDGKFLIFKTYQEGFSALCDYLIRVCEGRHKAYPKGGETTLFEFQKIYSPSLDNNDPLRYATTVARKLGINITDKIKTLL